MASPPKKPFLSYSPDDRDGARKLYAWLYVSARGFWRDWRERPHYEMPPLLTPRFTAGIAIAAAALILALLVDATAVRHMRPIGARYYSFFAFVTDFGKSGYLFFVTGLATLAALQLGESKARGRARTGLYLLAGRASYLFMVLFVSGLASQIFKRVGRARPRFLEEGGPFQFDPFSFSASWASFPSGHTVTAFAFAMGLGYLLPKWRDPLLGFAALVGVSRIVLGAHYVSDVVGGAIIGIASALLLQRAFAARAIVFTPDAGRLAVRGQGLVFPALRSLARR